MIYNICIVQTSWETRGELSQIGHEAIHQCGIQERRHSFIFGVVRISFVENDYVTAIILCFLVTKAGIGGEKQTRDTFTCGILCLVRREVLAHKSFHREGLFFVCFFST
jgi:hypothetical protein